MQARGEPGELDLLVGEAQPPRGARCELGDTLGVAARIDVAGVHGPGEAGGCAEAGGAVGAAGQPLELGELDHVGPVGADAVLAVLLGPVEALSASRTSSSRSSAC